jgi:hypothetical protein
VRADRPLLILAITGVAACGFSAPLGAEPDATAAAQDATVDGTANVCSTAHLQCSQPGVTLACGGDCWVGCKETTSFAIAKQRCIDWGGTIATIYSSSINQCVNANFQTGTARWIGLEQVAGAAMPTAGWSWSDGTLLAYTNWSGGQPSDGDGTEDGTEQCAYMSNPGGGWQDTACTDAIGAFICRR